MLKIKDNVDLKELEKFGFKEVSLLNGNKSYKKSQVYVGLFYSKKRIIYTGLFDDTELDIIFDLIQAGFVEKVENDN